MNIKNLLREIRNIFAYREMKIGNMDYEEYWTSREDDVFKEGSDNTEKIISDIIEKNSTVMDIGCGDGRLLNRLRAEKRAHGEGIDVSATAAKRCREKGMKCTVVDIQKKFRLSKKYDYIVITDVLEHIPNPEFVMENLRDSFNKKLIISLPNIGMVFNRARLLFGKFPLEWYWHPGEHIRHWTLADIKWWIRSNKNFGCRIAGIYSNTGIPLLRKLWPSMFSAGFVVVLERDIA
ncbi:MAG: methyltransferase domain-containing protein [Candidatus Aenigmarchaeota archaeon]|nr:methyltransferase domain-containing protein [Candidatus Aenigmarchaeota archaeon]